MKVLKGLKVIKKVFLICLKKVFPKGLMGRTILSLIIPILLLQTLVGFVFYDRHWDVISKRLVDYYVNSIRSVEYFIDFENRNQQWIKNYFKDMENMDVNYFPHRSFVKKDNVYPYLIKNYPSAEVAFKELWGDAGYNIIADEDAKRLKTEVSFNGGTLVVESSMKKLFTSSTFVVYLWIVLGGVLAILMAVPFIRGQVRSIKELAKATEDFGRGKDVVDFRPSGATEIRRTGKSFLLMQDRVKRFFDNRMNMLFAISHDLKTPLTRMLLEVQKSKDLDLKDSLVEEIEDMKKMIDEYLDYAKGEGGEKTKAVNVNDLFENCLDKFKSFERTIVFKADEMPRKFEMKPEAIKRCLDNIIMNAVRYSEGKILVKLKYLDDKKSLIINVEDDGDGIPEDKREYVFKPFTRMEHSRNASTGGVGLGLAIAKEIVLSHGGEIALKEARSLKGLRVKIILPV